MRNYSTANNSQLINAFDQADTCQENLDTLAELLQNSNPDEDFNGQVAAGVSRLIKHETRNLKSALAIIEERHSKPQPERIRSVKK